MSTPTMRRGATRGKVGGYVPHVSRMATVLSTPTRSAVAAQRDIERTKANLAEMAVVAASCPLMREWYRAYLAPFRAVAESDSATEALTEVLLASAIADATEDASDARFRHDPSPENRRRLVTDLRIEIARKQDALAALEVQ